MAIGSKRNINELWKEYWLDVAGTSTAKSVNDAMRAGLEALGFSGTLSKMLKAWAVDQGGTSATITQAMIHSWAPVATAIEDCSLPSASDVTSEDAFAVMSTNVTEAAP